jgi:hypothetical protein
MIECDKCGDTFKDWRGTRGHIQFSHGEPGEVSDNYRDHFTKAGEERQEATDEDVRESVEDAEGSDPEPSDGTDTSLYEYLTTPITELIR